MSSIEVQVRTDALPHPPPHSFCCYSYFFSSTSVPSTHSTFKCYIFINFTIFLVFFPNSASFAIFVQALATFIYLALLLLLFVLHYLFLLLFFFMYLLWLLLLFVLFPRYYFCIKNIFVYF